MVVFNVINPSLPEARLHLTVLSMSRLFVLLSRNSWRVWRVLVQVFFLKKWYIFLVLKRTQEAFLQMPSNCVWAQCIAMERGGVGESWSSCNPHNPLLPRDNASLCVCKCVRVIVGPCVTVTYCLHIFWSSREIDGVEYWPGTLINGCWR